MARPSGRATATKKQRMAVSRPRQEARVARMAVFPSALGWIAIVGRGEVVEQLTFGHDSPREAIAALGDGGLEARDAKPWHPRLVARLQAYVERGNDDFRDVQVELGACTPFQRRVLEACRHVPYGGTITYGELAKAAGYPGAARAVGSVMANNHFSLIVPCHRVLAAGGRLGGYSNRLGLGMKKQLLALEAAHPLKRRRPAKPSKSHR
jgi:methylated-DNA-[protein]-cysteine S-methyltransferase